MKFLLMVQTKSPVTAGSHCENEFVIWLSMICYHIFSSFIMGIKRNVQVCFLCQGDSLSWWTIVFRWWRDERFVGISQNLSNLVSDKFVSINSYFKNNFVRYFSYGNWSLVWRTLKYLLLDFLYKWILRVCLAE